MILISLAFITQTSLEPINIKVACSKFPPYFYLKEGECSSGRAIDMINRWNKLQDRYRFSTYLTSPKRRQMDLYLGNYDISLYDEPSWGWDLNKINYSCIYETGSEVFFSKNKKNDSFFTSLKNKKIAAMRGYHYAFAKFNNNEKLLKKSYNISLLNSQTSIIGHVLKERSDIGVITEGFFDEWLNEDPSRAGTLYKSKIKDQIYNFRVILRNDAPISMEYIQRVLGVRCI